MVNAQRLAYPDIARLIGTGLISTGVGLLLFVFVTVAWGDPFTYLSEKREQDRISEQLGASVGVGQFAGATQQARLNPRLTCASARRYRRSLGMGDGAARIRIPAIGLTKYVVKGAGVPELIKGPGFYKETAFPGCGTPVAIAGHRTTHGAPFLHIDRLRPGDPIVLDLPYGRFTYRVSRTQIITPRDWSIINVGAAARTSAARAAWRRSYQARGACGGRDGTCEHLVMTACHPKYSARQRIAVFSILEKVQLRSRSAGNA